MRSAGQVRDRDQGHARRTTHQPPLPGAVHRGGAGCQLRSAGARALGRCVLLRSHPCLLWQTLCSGYPDVALEHVARTVSFALRAYRVLAHNLPLGFAFVVSLACTTVRRAEALVLSGQPDNAVAHAALLLAVVVGSLSQLPAAATGPVLVAVERVISGSAVLADRRVLLEAVRDSLASLQASPSTSLAAARWFVAASARLLSAPRASSRARL